MRNPFRKKALTATPAVLDALGERGWSPYPLLGWRVAGSGSRTRTTRLSPRITRGSTRTRRRCGPLST